jgi:hypothetical protein
MSIDGTSWSRPGWGRPPELEAAARSPLPPRMVASICCVGGNGGAGGSSPPPTVRGHREPHRSPLRKNLYNLRIIGRAESRERKKDSFYLLDHISLKAQSPSKQTEKPYPIEPLPSGRLLHKFATSLSVRILSLPQSFSPLGLLAAAPRWYSNRPIWLGAARYQSPPEAKRWASPCRTGAPCRHRRAGCRPRRPSASHWGQAWGSTRSSSQA